jgi:glutathione synthase/RimK-type ligase-like ATP-grasp enzyme
MNVVVKKRKGSGGSDVHHVKNEIDLEKTVLIELKEVLQKGIVISPYQKIEDEYRVLILNDKALCIYKKNRIFLQGDGKSNLLQLINSQIDKNFRNEIISSLLDENKDLNTVINEDEKLLVS